MRSPRVAVLALVAAASSASAAAPPIVGDYDSPLGRVRVEGDGATFRGILAAPSASCGFRPGDEVLRATLLDDSLAGQVRVCLHGKACRAREEWASAVLLATGEKLSGAVHVGKKGCAAPLGKKGGISFVKAEASAATSATGATTTSTTTTTATSTTPQTPSPRRSGGEDGVRRKSKAKDQARDVLRDGAAYLSEGNFEAARRRFLEAIEIAPAIPEAYNGVGVTYRMRNDLRSALQWYKKALAVDPDFGDAYYNMACVYALQGDKEMALRYLQIAALNGYATAEGMDQDPDLEPLRGEPGYRALVRAKM